VLDSDGVDLAPTVEPLTAPRRPGWMSWSAWILFFGLTLYADLVPYLPARFGGGGETIAPGMLDDPKMIAWSIVGAWISLLLVVGLAWRARLTRRDMGLVSLPTGRLLRWAGLVFAGLAVTGIAPSLVFGDKLGVIEAITRPPEGASGWMLWFLLAASAGVAEEVIMRGYGIGFLLRAGVSRWGAAVGMALYFGLLHIYQGPAAVPVIAIWGFLFAWSYLATGSLYPGMIAHTLVDAIAPLFIGR